MFNHIQMFRADFLFNYHSSENISKVEVGFMETVSNLFLDIAAIFAKAAHSVKKKQQLFFLSRFNQPVKPQMVPLQCRSMLTVHAYTRGGS